MSSLNPVGYPFIELLSVDSTNNYAMGMVHAGMAQHGLAVFAREQTRGRGQRNRQWLAGAGQNITASFVIEPPSLSTSQMFLLSKMIALAVYRFFNKYAMSEVAIKWPNDLYWRDRKAGGILIENLIQGSEWKFAIAGIGININQTDFEEAHGRAVSLKQITGRDFDPLLLVKELSGHINDCYSLLASDPATISDQYHSILYKQGEQARFRKEGRVFEARVNHVTDLGELVVQHAAEERFGVGEIEWVL